MQKFSKTLSRAICTAGNRIPFIVCNILITTFTALIFLVFGGCGYITQTIASGASAAFPGCVYRADTDEKVIALTIDDGPDSVTTREILTLLDKYNARATFFLLAGRIKANEAVVEEIVGQGHELGHHMMTGKTTIRLPYDEFTTRFDKADSILSEYADIRWFRPGSGWYSDEMIKYISGERYNYRCVLGSVYPFDVHLPSSVFASIYISVNTRPGSIIVLHDKNEHGRRTVKVLSRIIPKLQERGYRFVTLSELFRTNDNDNME